MKERGILFSAPMVRAILDGRKTQTRRVLKPRAGEWLDWFTDEDNGGRPAIFFSDEGHSGPGWYVHSHNYPDEGSAHLLCPYGQFGDRLWVRETWAAVFDCPELPCCEDGEGTHRRVVYRATEPGGVEGFCRAFDDESPATWRPSIFMRRADSRLTLGVTGVRVERLQDISNEDAKAEGLARLSKDRCRTWKYGIADRDGLPGSDDDGMPWDAWSSSPRVAFHALWSRINGAESWDANPWVWVIEFKRAESKSEAA